MGFLSDFRAVALRIGQWLQRIQLARRRRLGARLVKPDGLLIVFDRLVFLSLLSQSHGQTFVRGRIIRLNADGLSELVYSLL